MDSLKCCAWGSGVVDRRRAASFHCRRMSNTSCRGVTVGVGVGVCREVG